MSKEYQIEESLIKQQTWLKYNYPNKSSNPIVFAASKMLREQNYSQREDCTPLHYT